MANFSIIAKLGMDDGVFGKKLKGLKSSIGGIGSQIGTAVKAGVAVAGVAVGAFVAKSVSSFIDFEKKITEVKTLLPKMTEGGFQKMSKDLREMSKVMGVDILESTQALYNAISAGIPEKNAVSFLQEASKLAIAGVTELDTAVSGLTTVLGGYNMETSEASKISDILFATMQNGKTTIGELSANIGKVTPLASELGVSFEEVGAMFATLTLKLGDGKTAEAGTQIKSMLAELGKSGTKAADAFERLAGTSFQNFIKNGGSVGEALKLMSKGAEESGEGLQNMFGSIEAGMGALAIAANDGQNLATALGNIRAGTGGVDKGFAEMEKTVARQTAKMKSLWKETMLKMGEALLPLVNKVLPMFIGLIEAVPKMFGDSEVAGSGMTAMIDGIVTAVKFAIKVLVSVVVGLKNFASILVYCGKQIGTFVGVFVLMGKTAFDPIVQVIAGVVDAFKALGDILSDPFDPENYEKAFDRINGAFDKIKDSVGNWGDSFKDGMQAGSEMFKKHNDEFVKDMRKGAKTLNDVWEETGDFAFLSANKAKEGANDLADAMGGAANEAGRMAGNLGGMAFNIRQASTSITRHLVKALARGEKAGTPLAKMMADIQAKSKDIATFWNQAAGDFAKVAGGKIELKIKGFKGGKAVEGFVRDMGKLEKELRGGAGRIAALAPEAMAKVMEAFENSGRKDASVLSTMYENAQRAQDMTLEGLSKLDSEIEAITSAAEQSAVPLEHLNKETRTYIEWLKTRRDIAEENLQIQLQQMQNARGLGAQMDELQSLLGTITDLEGKKDAESIAEYKRHKEELMRITKEVGIAVEEVKKEAEDLGIQPEQVEAVNQANKFLAEVEARKFTESEWLEKIHGILETMDGKLTTISEALPDVLGKNKDEAKELFGALSQESTQQTVLETLEGYFVNQ